MEPHTASAPGEEPLHAFRFKAMNTSVECALQCPASQRGELELLARDWFGTAERRFSRFRPDSELSHLNRLAGERCMISAAMTDVLQLAHEYTEITEGLFDPFVLDALLEAGYDETFDIVKLRPSADAPPVRTESGPQQAGRRLRMEIDPVIGSLRLPPHAPIDLGGIVKSWSAQRLAAYYRNRRGIGRGLVNAGGDLAAWGDPADGAGPWRIAIEHPWTMEADAGLLLLHSGAAATSGTLGRRWMSPHGPKHHLIDPVSLSPSDSDIVQCTVAGRYAVECEIWAKTICIAGATRGLSLFAEKADPGCEALLFTADRRVLLYGKLSSPERRWLNIPDVRLLPVKRNSAESRHVGGDCR
ncbi:FAD:protein FMN transferase [Paenibacillus humicola]|uniref:FAD:protein FMN transferase n=1 Tax=Paenibacillus humicola TaxID=3110540 RepID=UPI00237AD47A|nr:FAD:protein FMN transferase [Paenibacillus humicola]